jgi:hypothetical protein
MVNIYNEEFLEYAENVSRDAVKVSFQKLHSFSDYKIIQAHYGVFGNL